MLMGLDFYKRAVELQKKYANSSRQVTNALQTNGVLIDEKWAKFLCENDFLVGISIDGPKEFHDHFRRDYSGKGSFDRVISAIEKCREFGVEFNLLTLINRKNADHADELFDFLIGLGTKFLQFIACVETEPATGEIADFAVTPEQYGNFLCRIFDRWSEYGPNKLSIRDFDSILSYCITGKATICTFNRQCSDYIVVEHNGDTFPCDFFVEPKWLLGNILETPIEQLAASSKKRAFGRMKKNLCDKCLTCRHLAVCRGGCMKDRAPFDSVKFASQSYLCQAYCRFFDYAMPKFMQIAATINTASATSKGPFTP